MNTQVNWQKIRDEFQRITDIDSLKSEVQRIRSELSNFDYHSVLSPAAKARMKAFEKRYAEVLRSIQQTQRQVDREVNRVVRQIKTHRNDVSKLMTEQRSKLETLSKDFRKRFMAQKGNTAKTSKTTSVKKTAKKTTGNKRRASK